MDKGKGMKMGFVSYFDGGYEFEPQPDVPNTYKMGICHLGYIEETNTLVVHLRRPGLLIGKGGRTLKEVEEYLNCKIDIKEINLLK